MLDSWTDRIGWVLVHSLWQFALAALLAVVLQRALRRRSATTRYAALLGVMAVMVAAPAATWFSPWSTDSPAVTVPLTPIEKPQEAPPLQQTALPEHAAAPVELPALPVQPVVDLAPQPQPEPPRPESSTIDLAAFWSTVKSRVQPWLPEIVLAWLVGVLLAALRPLLSWYTVRRLRTVGVSPVADAVQNVLERTAKRLRLARAVDVLQSTLVKAPVVVGYFRPVVLLPLCVVTGLPAVQLEAILAHELAHIRRHDYLVNLLQMLVETIFFYHPAVWWLSRQIRNERENCCDDVAVAAVDSRADYGRALLAIEELRAASPAFSLAAQGGSLLARIRRIAGYEPTPHIAGGGSILCGILASLALFAALTWAAVPAAEKPEQASATTENRIEQTTAETVVTGQVVNSEGKPIAAAQVAIMVRPRDSSIYVDLANQSTLLASANADREGRFRLKVPKISSAAYFHATAVAAADGFNFGGQEIGLDVEQPNVTISLTTEQTIRGQVVDTNNAPVANAEIHARTIGSGGPAYEVECFDASSQPPFWPKPVTSDQQGHFVLRGVDRNGTLVVRIHDKRFASSDYWIAPVDKVSKAGGASNRVRVTSSGDVTLLPPPSRICEGQITYGDTHKPVANARVEVWRSYDGPGGADLTDAAGHFRLNLQSGKTFYMTVYPPDGEPYLIVQKKIDLADGEQLPKIAIALPRGVLLQGKVVEKGSGQPIAGATIQFNEYPRSGYYAPERTVSNTTPWPARVATKADGTFAIAAPPGFGLLLVRGPGGDFIRQEVSSADFQIAWGDLKRHHVSAFVPLDLKIDQKPAALNIAIRRGATIRGRIVGPGNRPVDDVRMASRHFLGFNNSGSSPVRIKDGQFELHGLDPEVAVPFYFLDAKNELGATVEISGKSADAGPLVVHLQPCGKAVARFVDREGKPQAQQSSSATFVLSPKRRSAAGGDSRDVWADTECMAYMDFERHGHDHRTDDNGKVTFPTLIPGAAYQFGLFNKCRESDDKVFSVRSGETLQVPDIVVYEPGDTRPPAVKSGTEEKTSASTGKNASKKPDAVAKKNGSFAVEGTKATADGKAPADTTRVQTDDSPFVMATVPGRMLLSQRSVQAELNLTEEQKKRLSEIVAGFLVEQRPSLESSSLAELQQNSDRLNRETCKQMDAVLTPQQLQKLKDIDLHLNAFEILLNPAELAKLGISARQQLERRRRAVDAMNEMRRKIGQVSQEINAKAMAVLTPQQRVRLQEEVFRPGWNSLGMFHAADLAGVPVPRFDPFPEPDLRTEGVAKELKLTATQQDQVRAVMKEHEEQSKELSRQWRALSKESNANWRELRNDRLSVSQKSQQLVADLRKRTEALLTPQQLASYRDMAVRNVAIHVLRDEQTLWKIGTRKEQNEALRRLEQESIERPQQIQREMADAALKLFTPAQLETLHAEFERIETGEHAVPEPKPAPKSPAQPQATTNDSQSAIKATLDVTSNAKNKSPSVDANTWKPGQTLDLRIINANTKEPLPGVSLHLQFSGKGINFQDIKIQTTDAQGRSEIRLPDLKPDAVRVYTSKAGFVPLRVFWGSDDDPVAPPVVPKTVTIPMEPGTPWGGVVRNEKGEPIPNVAVNVRYWDHSSERNPYLRVNIDDDIPGTVTDKNGRWRLDILPAKFTDHGPLLFFMHPDYVGDHLQRSYSPVPVTERPSYKSLQNQAAVTVLRKGTTIAGRVTDEAGKPIAGAIICNEYDCYDPDPLKITATTDADGNFHLSGLSHRNNYNTYFFAVKAAGYSPVFVEHTDAGKPADIKLKRGQSVQGQVVDGNGKPIEGASIKLDYWMGRPRQFYLKTTTDAAGKFRIEDAPSDRTEYDIEKQGFMTARRPLPPSSTGYTITLRSLLRVAGSIVDSETNEPLAKCRLTKGWDSEDGRTPQWETSIGFPAKEVVNGRYEFEFTREHGARIRAEADGYLPAVSRLFNPGDTDNGHVTYDFRLKKGHLISGTVLGLNEKPLAGAEVFIATQQFNVKDRKAGPPVGEKRRMVKTDEKGRFEFPPEVEPFYLAVLHDEGHVVLTEKQVAVMPTIRIQPWTPQNQTFSAERRPPTHANKSSAADAKHTLIVRVIDPDGKPVEDAVVAAETSFRAGYNYVGPNDPAWTYFRSAVSDSNGMARIANAYDRCVVARHVERKLVGMRSISPEQIGGANVVTLTMQPQCKVTGRLTSKDLDAHGRKLTWTNVYVYLEDGMARPMCCASNKGEYHFYLPPGTYKLNAYGTDVQDAWKTITVKPGQEELEVEPIDLPPTGLVLLEGKPAPELRDILAWKNGGPVKLSDLRGKVVILAFSSEWSGSGLQGIMPELFPIYKKYRDQGLAIIEIRLDIGLRIESEAKLTAKLAEVKSPFWKDRNDLPIPIALVLMNRLPFRPGGNSKSPCPLLDDYRGINFQTGVLIDRQGRVVGQLDPRTRSNDAAKMALLEKVLKQK